MIYIHNCIHPILNCQYLTRLNTALSEQKKVQGAETSSTLTDADSRSTNDGRIN